MVCISKSDCDMLSASPEITAQVQIQKDVNSDSLDLLYEQRSPTLRARRTSQVSPAVTWFAILHNSVVCWDRSSCL